MPEGTVERLNTCRRAAAGRCIMSPASAVSRSLSVLLPSQPTPLVGRSDELATIRWRLADEGVRLLTLVGPAGVGKTRLAVAAAEQLAIPNRFPDGVVFVNLAPVRDPTQVLSSLAAAVGLLDVGNRPLLDRLREALGERQQLVVLDNVEQVLPAAPLADLLAACQRLALLVTSRVPLGLRREQTHRLTTLPVGGVMRPAAYLLCAHHRMLPHSASSMSGDAAPRKAGKQEKDERHDSC
jgi:AAA domain